MNIDKKAELAQKLTPKQKMYADKILSEPTRPRADIIREVYNPTTTGTVRQIAHANIRNTKINNYLAMYNQEAEMVTVDVMNNAITKDTPTWQRLALDASRDIQNRVTGLPVARTENISTVLAVNLDLTGDTVAEPQQ